MLRWSRGAADPAYDGIPAHAFPAGAGRQPGQLPQRDFDLGRGLGLLPGGGSPPAATAVLITSGDGRADWLRAGQALHRLLAHAAGKWVFASLYTQPPEAAAIRTLIHDRLPGWRAESGPPAGRFTFHVLAAMDEMLADLISEGTREGLESARARGRAGGRKPKLTTRQAEVARGMYDETGADDRRKYTVAEIAETFGVSRKTVYRHLEPSADRRQPGKSARPAAPAGPLATLPDPAHDRASEPAARPRARPAAARAPGLPGLRARTRHQRRGTAATRRPRHLLAAPRRRPPHRGPALRGMPATRARHRRQLLPRSSRPGRYHRPSSLSRLRALGWYRPLTSRRDCRTLHLAVTLRWARGCMP